MYLLKNKNPIIAVGMERLGVVASPYGVFQEEGVLNPAVYQDRAGNLVVMMRSVARGNQSRLEMIRQRWENGKPCTDAAGNEVPFQRVGFALVPQAAYERRRRVGASGAVEFIGGEGCEDARVTFIRQLDRYLMCYTAFGPAGPRIALAWSHDGYKWHRLGLLQIPEEFALHPDDKDAAFFPEPVLSPKGVLSIALYHRPMVNIPASDGMDVVQATLSARPDKRQCIRIAYIPLDKVLKNIRNVLQVRESKLVFEPLCEWGSYKCGAGTAPVRINSGWLEIFHGVDQFPHPSRPSGYQGRYAAGIIVHDIDRPDKIRYYSAEPVIKPETKDELEGIVNNVVFPTGIVERADMRVLHADFGYVERVFDVYYGMADRLIGRFRLTVREEA
ncbi:MAG: hypothetical protein IT343_22770 [Candidatus Melainabacteria bacterium]|jgi:predicted GH43/DUF377 family glycosyl hydrolase|nr:hypothetical protein [Candidatus Melainabacteria bacterium]